MDIIQLKDVKFTPETPSQRLIESVKHEGLLTPLLVDKETLTLHRSDNVRFTAFKILAEAAGEKGNKTVKVCFWEDLDEEEKEDVGEDLPFFSL